MTITIVAAGKLPGNSNNNDECCSDGVSSNTKDFKGGGQGRFVWNDVLDEVFRRKARGQKASILSDTDKECETLSNSASKKRLQNKSSLTRYKLGANYKGIYFTKREAECMKWLLVGKTHSSIATILKLSPRSIEYYISNMRTKLGCRTKYQLIDLVRASEFMKNVDFL